MAELKKRLNDIRWKVLGSGYHEEEVAQTMQDGFLNLVDEMRCEFPKIETYYIDHRVKQWFEKWLSKGN